MAIIVTCDVCKQTRPFREFAHADDTGCICKACYQIPIEEIAEWQKGLKLATSNAEQTYRLFAPEPEKLGTTASSAIGWIQKKQEGTLIYWGAMDLVQVHTGMSLQKAFPGVTWKCLEESKIFALVGDGTDQITLTKEGADYVATFESEKGPPRIGRASSPVLAVRRILQTLWEAQVHVSAVFAQMTRDLSYLFGETLIREIEPFFPLGWKPASRGCHRASLSETTTVLIFDGTHRVDHQYELRIYNKGQIYASWVGANVLDLLRSHLPRGKHESDTKE